MKIEKWLFLDIFVVSLLALGCFLTAMLSEQMVSGNVKQSEAIVKSENGGDIKFGLIWGTKQFNYGYGTRDKETYFVYNEYSDLHPMPVIISTLLCIGVSCIFTFMSIVFGLMNSMVVPVQVIHGPNGLFIWNSIAAGFSLVATIMYAIIYMTTIKDQLYSEDGTFSDIPHVQVGYSFWLLLCGVLLVASNIIVVYLAKAAIDDEDFFKLKTKPGSKVHVEQSKNISDGIMY